MKYLAKFKFLTFLVLGLSVGLVSCSDDNEPNGNGDVEVEVTDAAVDNAEVEGVFVTVTDVKIDGKSATSFQGTQSFDLMALQNGKTRSMISEQFGARSNSRVSFILDLQSDAQGNTPGCYVMTADGKQALEMDGKSEVELLANGSFDIAANTANKMVVDFDLRKLIKFDGEATGSDRYSFVSSTEANAALRLTDRNASGTIKGSLDNSAFDDADKVVVYAYGNGQFNANTESNASGSGDIRFRNAVNSTVVSKSAISNDFELHFLEEGEYELVFAGFNESTSSSGKAEFAALIDADMSVDGEVTNIIEVKANSSINLDVSLKGFLN